MESCKGDFREVEAPDDKDQSERVAKATFAEVTAQFMLLDLIFSLGSVVAAIGIADHFAVMIAAVVAAISVTMISPEPLARFFENGPSTKMLALEFLFIVGMALWSMGFISTSMRVSSMQL